MKKSDKEYKKYEQIGEGVTMIRDSRESIEKLAKRYDQWIDEAAELGEDDYSNQLIEDKVELNEFARNLSFLEVKVTESAVSANTFSGLKNLPVAMSACKSLLTAAPDLKKLGKQMASFKTSLDGARTSLKGLRTELSKSKNPACSELFGIGRAKDPKMADKIEAEKKAREARLAAKISKNVPNPVASENTSENMATNMDDIIEMINEENKKG